jgi:hypothetical protein
MAISETARRNHDQLFPDHGPTLVVTDPELIEVFYNFAFDDVLAHSRLDTRTRLMVHPVVGPSLPFRGARSGDDCLLRFPLTLQEMPRY